MALFRLYGPVFRVQEGSMALYLGSRKAIWPPVDRYQEGHMASSRQVPGRAIWPILEYLMTLFYRVLDPIN